MRALIAAACHTIVTRSSATSALRGLARPPGLAVPERWHPSPVTLTTRAFTPGGAGFNPRRFELIDFDLV